MIDIDRVLQTRDFHESLDTRLAFILYCGYQNTTMNGSFAMQQPKLALACNRFPFSATLFLCLRPYS